METPALEAARQPVRRCAGLVASEEEDNEYHTVPPIPDQCESLMQLRSDPNMQRRPRQGEAVFRDIQAYLLQYATPKYQFPGRTETGGGGTKSSTCTAPNVMAPKQGWVYRTRSCHPKIGTDPPRFHGM